jgi:hypothetical protein
VINYYEAGKLAAYAQLGLTKNAGFMAKAVPHLKNFGKSVMRNFIGQPKQFGKEIMQGKALSRGGMIHSSLAPKGMMGKAMVYGLPAWQADNIIRDDDPHKMRRLGAVAGGAALGMGLWGPLGMAGSALAYPVGERIGRGAVKSVEGLVNREAP